MTTLATILIGIGLLALATAWHMFDADTSGDIPFMRKNARNRKEK